MMWLKQVEVQSLYVVHGQPRAIGLKNSEDTST